MAEGGASPGGINPTYDADGDGVIDGDKTVAAGVSIETQMPSAAAAADFTSSFGNHETHIFHLHNVVPATDGAILLIRTSTDGGSNWDSGASDYMFGRSTVDINGGTSDAGSGAGSAHIPMTTSVGSAAGEDGVSGTVTLYGTSLAKKTGVVAELTHLTTGGNAIFSRAGGFRMASEDVTGVRFLFDSGNIESGTIEHLGVN